MKIVHICLGGPMTDGWNYQENMLAKYHKMMGLDVIVVASKWVYSTNGKLIKTDKARYTYNGIKMIRISNLFGNINSKLKLFKGLYTTLNEEKPDIIFVHGVQYLDIFTITKYIKKNSPIVYVDNHADFINSATNWLSKNVLHKILWKACANHIEPYTRKFYGVLPIRVEFLTNMYQLPKDKCELLVMGGDTELIQKCEDSDSRTRIRRKYGISDNDFLIITGGKFDSKKRQYIELMRAIKSINEKRLKMIVFGSVSDEMRAEFDLLVDSEKIQYAGWIQGTDTYDYFSAADLVVFPGRHSVFWEQVVAQGIPLLCHRWEGITHIDVGGNVFYLENANKEEICNKIVEVMDNTEKYSRMKQMAKTKGKKYFSYYEIAKKSIEM